MFSSTTVSVLYDWQRESLEVCLMDITKWIGVGGVEEAPVPFKNNWCDWDSCMWVPDKEIYGETTEAKKEGAHLKFPIKLSVRHRAAFNRKKEIYLKFFPLASYLLANKIPIKAVSLGCKKWTPRGKFLHSYTNAVLSLLL